MLSSKNKKKKCGLSTKRKNANFLIILISGIIFMQNQTVQLTDHAIIDFTHLDHAPDGYFAAAMGWYFHGELESKVGYDLAAASEDLMLLEDGIYAGTWQGHDCTFFFWTYISDFNIAPANDPSMKHKRYRGLIVLNTDKSSFEDAHKKYTAKVQFL